MCALPEVHLPCSPLSLNGVLLPLLKNGFKVAVELDLE
jgi:hypothetical protein